MKVVKIGHQEISAKYQDLSFQKYQQYNYSI